MPSGVDGTGAFVVGRYHLAGHSPTLRDRWPPDAILARGGDLVARYGASGHVDHGFLAAQDL